MKTFSVRTSERMQMVDITREVQAAVEAAGLRSGMALIFVPHTTAAVTINENADPSVAHDILADLTRLVPPAQRYYQHAEGNSAAHLLSTLVGCSQTVLVEQARLVLGTWQGIYFCEFDGPRDRRVIVRLVPAAKGSPE
ncbi:MAG: secondary thiamine-phosphate synthase enzyme YjbQ [Candidatus Eisenbacteria bacterium]